MEAQGLLPPASPVMAMAQEEITVTGSRVRREDSMNAMPVVAVQEDLGALKLYRIPIPVTVAANSQKQVALLVREGIPVETVYRGRIGAGQGGEVSQSRRVLVTRNREQERLGVPLPSGAVAAFVDRSGQAFLIGEGRLDDRAVGEDVEIEIGQSPGVNFRQEVVARGPDGAWQDIVLTVTSDQPRPIRFEAELPLPDGSRITRVRLPERDGYRLWSVMVPANGTMTLRYRLERPAPR